jgi:transcriptional regulator with XRE-family HTH domain
MALPMHPLPYSLGSVTPIAVRLKELREARGLSQAGLAKLAGVAQSYISRIEAGRLSTINLAHLEKLARALDVNAALLIDHRPKK